MPGSAFYNMPFALRMRGRLRAPALGAAMAEIVRRHEVLRTTFREVDGETVQVVGEARSGLGVPAVDVSGLPVDGRRAEAQRLAREEAERSFDLVAGPLLRVRLVRLGSEEHVLLLTQHHIVSDGWSFGVLCRELAALYGAFSSGRASPLPELAVQYADFAVWQRDWLRGEVLERQLGWWKQLLGEEPPALELPHDRPRPAVQSFRGGAVETVLSATLARRLEALARERGTTLATVLLAGFFALLHRVTGQEKILVGSPGRRPQPRGDRRPGRFLRQQPGDGG